jgi:hypothetical protein
MFEIGSMPNKTITKNWLVVISLAVACLVSAGCHKNVVRGGRPPELDRGGSSFGKPEIAGTIASDDITESSGIAASKCQENVFWTHNDSEGGRFIFALDQQGRDLGTWRVENSENKDWEDIAAYKDQSGNCFLLIGDIGNSNKNARLELTVYKVPEPAVQRDGPRSSKRSPRLITAAEAVTFRYPDEPQDSETLLIHPRTAEMFVVTKRRNRPAGVYKLKAFGGGGTSIAEKVAELTVPAIPNGFVTGGDISPDGSRVVICDYFAAYEFSIPDGTDLREIFNQKPVVVDLGERQQGEAIAYSADGSALFATSEGKHQALIRVARLQK